MRAHSGQCAQSCARRYVLIGEPDGGICGHAWRTWGLPAAASPSSSSSSPALSCEGEDEGVGGGDEACNRVQGLAHAVQHTRREHGCNGDEAHEGACSGPGAACGAQSMRRPRGDGGDPRAMQGVTGVERWCGGDGGARDGPGAPCGACPRAGSKRARGEEPAPGQGMRCEEGARRRQAARRECSGVAAVAPYAEDGFERVDLPELSRWQVCRTDERWLARRHSACVAFRRR